MRAKSVLTLGVLTIGAVSQGQITQSPEGYLFRKRFVKGTKWDYIERTQVTLGRNKGETTTESQVYVRDWDGKSAIIEMISTQKSGRNGRRQGQKSTFLLDERGQVNGSNAEMGIFSFVMPEKPMKPNESFAMYVNPAENPQQRIKHFLKFMGVRTMGKESVAEWSISTKSESGSLLMGKGTLFLSQKDGSLVRSELKLKASTMQNGKEVPIVAETLVTRK